jgi:hypothetical protein
VADALTGFIQELRLIELADFVAYLRLERHSQLGDLVTAAAEMFFAPQFLELGDGSYAKLDWSGQPAVFLNLVMQTAGATIYLTLTLQAERANVVINYIAFHVSCAEADEARSLVNRGIFTNLIRPRVLDGSIGQGQVC